ncbi:MAG: response regulator transcription factor [Chitinophagaceae bacterium]
MYRSPIKVMIADDHEIYRDGLRMMISREAEIELVGEAENGREVVEMARELHPEIILMDIVMPVNDGIFATRQLKEEMPGINVIALSMFNEDNLVVDMLDAGATGYLLKNADKKEIMEAIRSVYKQVPYYCSSTSGKLARMIARSRFNPFTKIGKLSFSDKEMDIIKMLCREYSNKEIAGKLSLSVRTVEGHRLKIFEKIGVKSTTGLVIYAMKNGIFKPD